MSVMDTRGLCVSGQLANEVLAHLKQTAPDLACRWMSEAEQVFCNLVLTNLDVFDAIDDLLLYGGYPLTEAPLREFDETYEKMRNGVFAQVKDYFYRYANDMVNEPLREAINQAVEDWNWQQEEA